MRGGVLMIESEYERMIVEIISSSGTARSHIFEALKEAKEYNFEKMDELLDMADNELNIAHSFQTNIIREEMKKENDSVTLLMVHAQDHLMTSMLARDLAEDIANLYREIYDLKNSK
jgi:cellobiose PTS system EIIA component